MFLIYVNNSSDNLFANAVIFADDASILSAFHNVDASVRKRERRSEREAETQRQSLSFNPVPNKHAQKIVLCCISKKHASVFNFQH